MNRLVKFRRGDKNDYEDLGGESTQRVVPNKAKFTELQDQSTPSSPGSTKPFQEDTYTVDQAVDAIGFGKFQVKLSFFTGLVWVSILYAAAGRQLFTQLVMADAMEMMILSILAPALHCDWNLTPFLQALLTTVVFAGMMVSSSLWGTVCDKYGRKSELIICSLFTFYYGILSALAPNYIWLLILRGLVGFGIGGVPQSVTLYTEFLPTSSRAKCVVMIELFWAIGACFIVFISIFVMPALGWRYLLGIAAIPLLIFSISCVWLPESARYHMACGNHEKALETLKRIADDNGKPMPLGRLVDSGGNNETNGGNVKRGQLSDLFTKELRLTTILLWLIWLANAFSYYGIVLMTTELFEVGDSCHGGDIGVVPGVEPACSLECKQLSTKDYTDLLWTTVAEFPGLFITFLIIEWLGRRWTMATEFLVFSFFVYLVNMCTTRTVLTIFLFVARAFISGAFQAAYVYTPEVYPTTTRALGLGSCSGMARIGALVTPFVAQVLLRKSVYITINLYATVCIFGAIAAVCLPIETKGREMKDTHIEPQKETTTNKK